MSAIQADELVGTLWLDDTHQCVLIFSRISGVEYSFIILHSLKFGSGYCQFHYTAPMNISEDFDQFIRERGLLKLGRIDDLDIESYLEENEQVKALIT